jgi:glycosyltransferase involved in cell wall biosynthesis
MKLVIASDLAPRKIGGMESTIFGLSRAARELGHEVVCLFNGTAPPPVREHFDITDGEVREGLGGLQDSEERARWIRAIREERPDVLLLNFFPTTGVLPARIRLACPRARIVIYDKVSRVIPNRPWPKRILCRLRDRVTARRADAFAAVSGYVSTVLQRVDSVDPSRIQVIHNGIDPGRYAPGSAEPQADLAATCYLRPEKGIDVLLKALVHLKRLGRNLSLRIAGDGPCLEEYRALAAEEGLDRVEFLGKRNDIPDIFRSARIAVMPSVWPEAFGYAAIEAMACARPVIASDVGGLPEVVDHGNTGLLVPPGDPKALADAIKALLDDPQRRHQMAAAARLRVEKLFTLHRQVQQLLLLLRLIEAENPNGAPDHPLHSATHLG